MLLGDAGGRDFGLGDWIRPTHTHETCIGYAAVHSERIRNPINISNYF